MNYVFEKRLYVELQRHYLRSEEDVNQQLVGLAHKLHLPIFASNGAYYADKQDREVEPGVIHRQFCFLESLFLLGVLEVGADHGVVPY